MSQNPEEGVTTAQRPLDTTTPAAGEEPPASLDTTTPAAGEEPPASLDTTTPAAGEEPPASLDTTTPAAGEEPPASLDTTTPAAGEEPLASLDRPQHPAQLSSTATPEDTSRADDRTDTQDPSLSSQDPVIPNGVESDKDLGQTDEKGQEEPQQELKADEEEEEKERKLKEEEGKQQVKEEREETQEEQEQNLEEERKEQEEDEETKEVEEEQTQEEKGKQEEEEETKEEKEQQKTLEEQGEGQEQEEKGDYSQVSGTDVSNMNGKGDSTKVSPRREATDVRETEAPSAGAKTTGNENGPAEDSKETEAFPNGGPSGDGREEGGEPSAATGQGQEDPGERAAPALDNNHETPAPHYEDDFSELSEASDRGAAVTAEAGTEKAQREKSSSATPGSKEEEVRAERGTVVPVPVAAQKKLDGRSSEEERGEKRGQNRSEAPCEEGEDSRGQGQWKSEDDERFLQSSLTNQHAEKEALQVVIDDKVKIQREFNDLKGHYLKLEEKSRLWEEDTSTLKQACRDQNTRIKELEEEQTRLREFEQWGQNNEGKIRDLQDRLGALGGEDAEKDRHIQKLQEELQDTRSRLVVAERQVAVNNAVTQQQAAQQSKTCSIL
ncbi:hypothetical protein ACOMHN_010119 [Nucella lapillus]